MTVAALLPQRAKLVVPAWLTPRRISQTDMHALMRRVLASGEAEGIRWLQRVWAAQRQGITVAEIEAALATGRIPETVLAAVRSSYSDFVAGKLADLMRGTAVEMGAGWARGADLPFDAAAVRLVDTLARRAENLPVELLTQQQDALDLVIRYFTESEQAHAGTIANTVRQFVGLTKRDANAVLNMRSKLLADGVSPSVVNRQTVQYADYLRQARALRIARTELAYSANAGKLEAIEQAIEAGILTGEVVREWSAAEDEMMCPICSDLDGQTAPLRGNFQGGYAGPPAHPNCRCVTIEIELQPKE